MYQKANIKVQILKYYGQFGSILEDFLIFKPYIHSFLIISPLKQNLLLIWVNLKTLPTGMLCAKLDWSSREHI